MNRRRVVAGIVVDLDGKPEPTGLRAHIRALMVDAYLVGLMACALDDEPNDADRALALAYVDGVLPLDLGVA